MGLYRKDKIFWFSRTVNGKRIQRSTGTTNRKLAEKIYAKLLTEIVEGKYFERVKADKTIFRELVEKYMQKNEKSRDVHTVKKLLPAFGHCALSEITSEAVSDYRDERLKKVKPATVYQELSLMRRMFNVARKEWKWVRDNPVADVSFSVGNKNKRDRWLTVEETQRLLICATNPSWLKGLLMLALNTGMRRGEILNLKWIDVDFKRKLIMVQRSKNGEKRSIPMNNALHNVLSGIKVRDISGKVFPMAVRSLREAYEKVLNRAGIENFRFHDLRHTFATTLVQKGVDLYKIKELLGHKTIAMTMRYAHHYPESLRSSVDVLDICYDSATFDTLAFDSV